MLRMDVRGKMGVEGLVLLPSLLTTPNILASLPCLVLSIQFHWTIIGEKKERDLKSLNSSNYRRSHQKHPPRAHLHLDASE